jgi:excisionase family DNA binding protein
MQNVSNSPRNGKPPPGTSDSGSDRRSSGDDPPEEQPSTEDLHRLLVQIKERLDDLKPGPPSLLTRKEAADVLGISVRKLDELAEAGRLKPTKIDRAVRYHPKTLERFVRRCTEDGQS